MNTTACELLFILSLLFNSTSLIPNKPGKPIMKLDLLRRVPPIAQGVFAVPIQRFGDAALMMFDHPHGHIVLLFFLYFVGEVFVHSPVAVARADLGIAGADAQMLVAVSEIGGVLPPLVDDPPHHEFLRFVLEVVREQVPP
eukprot:CAMPEP_0168339210 /NCGR_PEP_ID=MMETSP0213-20121227/13325_1 /TAXON_ID=151035 /ORGANISM="Euplotes harpa, Strain FSP1.4" /LENGTH=140 /DNA_ID=CAMNT_0008345197 /DNA_START=495 /DNA_END=917 /DNA_ORIENTATION=-